MEMLEFSSMRGKGLISILREEIVLGQRQLRFETPGSAGVTAKVINHLRT